MSEEIKMILGEDGVFREYNDEFDVTIHFESKEEQERFFKNYTKGQKSLEVWDKVIEEFNNLIEYGDTLPKTDNNIKCQSDYRLALEIVKRHWEGLEHD